MMFRHLFFCSPQTSRLNRYFFANARGSSSQFQRISQQSNIPQFKTDFMIDNKINYLRDLQKYRSQLSGILHKQVEETKKQQYDLPFAVEFLDIYLSFVIAHLNGVDSQLTQWLNGTVNFKKEDPKNFLIKLLACMKLQEITKLSLDVSSDITYYLFQVLKHNKVHELLEEFSDQICFGEDSKYLLSKGNQDKFQIALNRNTLQLAVIFSQLSLMHKFIVFSKQVKMTKDDSQFIEVFLDQVALSTLHLKLDWRTSYGLIKVISHYAAKLPRNEVTNLYSKFGGIISRCIDEMSANAGELKNAQIVLLMFMISKINMNTQNIRSYITFWSSMITVVSKRLPELKAVELKSLYYSLGKVGFINEDIEKFIISRVQASTHSNDERSDYLINLLISSSNLNLYNQIKDDMDKLIEKIYDHFNSQTQEGNIQAISKVIIFYRIIIKQMVLFFLCLLRLENTKSIYWKLFFDNFEKIISFSADPLGLLLQDLIIYKSHFSPENQRQVKRRIEDQDNIVQMIESFKTQFNSSKYYEKDYEQFTLENNIEKCLILKGVEFKRNEMFTLYECDFYIPKRNLILEVMGPHHYVFSNSPNGGEKFSFNLSESKQLNFYLDYNLVTKSKLRKLRSMGYTVKCINFFDLQQRNYEDIIRDLLQE